MKIKRFKELDSTNIKAKEYDAGSVIVADVQTKGHGRFSRQWSSGIGGAWFSIVVEPEAKQCQRLTFIAAIAARRAISKLCSLNCNVKWPNDIYANDKKLGGIFTECTLGAKNKCIIDIGINVNNDLPNELKEATSLKLLGCKVDKGDLIKQVVAEFENAIKEDFKKIVLEWKANSLYLNKNIRVETVNGSHTGKFIDVADDCSMILKTLKDKIIKIVEGTVYPI